MTVASTLSAVEAAIAYAIRFLAGARDERGLWGDFETLAGTSVDWVSGYVVVSLGGVPGAWSMCEEAATSLLARQRPSGGWGYHDRIPEDADSTAWVLGALDATLAPPHAVRVASEFLMRHQLATGGFATFRQLAAIGGVIGEPDRESLRGWGQSHTCVTANVTLALFEHGLPATIGTVRAALDYLAGARDADGLWSSYWWNGPAFATYYAARVLAATGRWDARELARTARALLAIRNPDGAWGDGHPGVADSHAFATAHALLGLLLAEPDPSSDDAAAAAARWLLDTQCEDGSWPTRPILRIPDAHVTDPRRPGERPQRLGTGIVVADHRRCFTAATVVHALHVYLRTAMLRGSGRS